MLDFITAICWAVVYGLIIFCTKNQGEDYKTAIPFVPPILNLSWEISALISCEAFWGHVIWFGLSVLVFESCLTAMNKKRQTIYFCCLIGSSVIFSYVFYIGGMLISSFVINMIMSICFWHEKERLLSKGKTWIALFKGIGTLVSTIVYGQSSLLVLLMGLCIAVLDVRYLMYCIREKREPKATSAFG